MMKRFCALAVLLAWTGCLETKTKQVMKNNTNDEVEPQALQIATFGGGCFWCTEAVFELVDGVKDVVSGYAGGPNPNPTYEEICTGETGHAEVVRITFDPSVVSFVALLDLFGQCHDPTSLNRQGADVGTQYRSVVMYHNEAQRSAAEKWKAILGENLTEPVVTQITAAPAFYPAEDYHQDYFRRNPNQSYCTFVIRPKLEKLKSNKKDIKASSREED